MATPFESLEKALRDIASGQIAPAYLVDGSDDFLIGRFSSDLVGALRKQCPDAELEQIQDQPPETARDLLMTDGLFSARRIAWIRDGEAYLGKDADEARTQVLRQALKAAGETLILVVSAPGAVAGECHKALVRAGVRVEAASPDLSKPRNRDAFLAPVARYLLAPAGKKISSAAFSHLVERAGTDTRQIFNELEKLVVYCGDRPEIRAQDIDALVGEGAEQRYYHLSEAVGARDAGKALAVFNRLMAQGEAALPLHKSLRRYLRSLLLAKSLFGAWGNGLVGRVDDFYARVDRLRGALPAEAGGETAEFLKQHPYKLYNLYAQSARFSEPELLRLYPEMVESETALKAYSFAGEAFFEDLLVRLAKGMPPSLRLG